MNKNPTSVPSENSPPAVGENLRRERKKRHLSIEKLALLGGVSKALISQIESGKVNPTIGTMWKLANALNISFEAIICGESAKKQKFEIRKGDSLSTLEPAGNQYRFKVLTPLATADDLELYLLTIAPHGKLDSEAHPEGTEEFLTINSGTVNVGAGDMSGTLKEGDVIFYDSDVPHFIENPGDTPAVIYMAVRFSNTR